MINTLKLKALLVEKSLTNELVAKELNLSKQTFSMKINNKREFKVSEIKKLIDFLNLNNSNDIMLIFFASNVDLKSTAE